MIDRPRPPVHTIPRSAHGRLPEQRPAQRDRRRVVAVAALIARSDPQRRVRALRKMLACVGPLALSVIAGGAFAKYLRYARALEIPVSVEDALRLTSAQILELVRYVAQSNPLILDRLVASVMPPNGAAATG